ncbi:hypothetical protein C0J52_23645, partial [Blattella germanica]
LVKPSLATIKAHSLRYTIKTRLKSLLHLWVITQHFNKLLNETNFFLFYYNSAAYVYLKRIIFYNERMMGSHKFSTTLNTLQQIHNTKLDLRSLSKLEVLTVINLFIYDVLL